MILTEWQAFRAPDFELVAERLARPVIFDGRNLFDPERMRRRGFTYYAIGRGAGVTAGAGAGGQADGQAGGPR